MAEMEALAETLQSSPGQSLESDLLVDVISLDGRVLWFSDSQAELLGTYDRDVAGLDAGAFYTSESFAEIQQLLHRRSRGEHAAAMELTLLAGGGRPIRTLARARFIRWRGEIALRLAKMDYGPVGNRYRQLEADFRTLSSMLETSSEAHWSIVFSEPVDTTLPKSEVVRQVFENQSVWRLCNPAMAQLYQLPESLDFNEQDVRLYWPRSAANERFVEEIINSDYAIDNALSIDRRHDGTLQYILNDVRGEVVDGFLLLLWGNCRDVTRQHIADDVKASASKLTARVLDGMADPVIILDDEGQVVSRNKAFAARFAGSRTIENLLIAHVRGRPRASGWSLFANSGGAGVLFDVHTRKVTGVDSGKWTVITVRERGADGAKRTTRQPRRP
ncbi:MULTISPECIES: PAS domain-containing protein [Alphaproteobacteria]|uniref:PAS domain-containing protein n=2 Tax=Alphaproteobacteria TaxID=28211 RepID=A0A512HGY3_9HYPH|nr:MULTISPECIES: PAS domain-containing protein [Alphaproteobacteria]GEO84713.1 hypothetical protein RNA01_16450 [Ciceribacter naphthalenivorans]GLR20666.1 hypothetical protein GCM10007920_04500 [Ciceribacter naphthalenivorans]GLT03522.1 hypothetical protein GCM10007926_04500 [Sphingomonas psychrolutea]